MRDVAIIDPSPVFALGLSLLIERCGLGQATVWYRVADATEALASGPVDLHVVSERLLGEFVASPLAGAARLVLVVDGGNSGNLGLLQSVSFDGLLLRDSPNKQIAGCLQAVASGHAWLDPALCDQFRQSQRVDLACLSQRELQIAALAADGHSNKQIAKILRLADGTVKIHLHHVFAKLHVAKRSELRPVLGASWVASGTADGPARQTLFQS